MLRKAILLTSSLVEITLDDDGYFVYSTTTFTSYRIRFKFGEEFDEHLATLSGGKLVIKSTITTDEKGVWTHTQKRDDPCTYIREVIGAEMKQVSNDTWTKVMSLLLSRRR